MGKYKGNKNHTYKEHNIHINIKQYYFSKVEREGEI